MTQCYVSKNRKECIKVKGNIEHRVTFLKLGKIYKVTKHISDVGVSETKLFKKKSVAERHFNNLKNEL